jgi:hypothetical protein
MITASGDTNWGLCSKKEPSFPLTTKLHVARTAASSTQRREASKLKAPQKWITDLNWSCPQPAYSTNLYIRNYERLMLVFFYLNGVGDQAWYPEHIGEVWLLSYPPVQ